MADRYSIIDFGDQNPFRCSMDHFGTIKTHSHRVFELAFLLAGECQARIGDKVYNLHAEDVLSIEANIPHSFSGVDCTVINIHIDQIFFERTLPDPRHPEFFCNSAEQGDNVSFDSLRRLIAKLVKNNSERLMGYELRNWAMIYEIMDVMYQNFRVEDSQARNQKAHRYNARMSQITKIIDEKYQDNLTLGQLADQVHLSAPYLSRFFEKQFGVTFLNYLTKVRLNHAVNELMETDATIETVSADSGFPNSHAFVQSFKKEYGLLPSLYRRRMKTNDTEETVPFVEQHDYMAGLKKYLDVPRDESLTVPSISGSARVSAAGSSRFLRHAWRNMTGVVSASAILHSDVQVLLKRIQKEIRFKYIKFNGVFSDSMHIYSEKPNGEPVYSYAFVDKVFDFLMSVNLRPLIQLGFMPEELAKTHKRLFGYLVSEPNSMEKWCGLVKSFVQHLIARYGAEEVHKWMFCVWEQPDTPEFLFGFSDDENYYNLYRETYMTVKECDPKISFGSPATFYIVKQGFDNWYLEFMKWCRDNECVPDFLNFHYYDTSFTDDAGGKEVFGFAGEMKLRDTPDGFGDFITQVRSERHAIGADALPIYLTEWNNTPSQQDLLNDTCFKSCYITKGILENYDRLDSFGYWSLTDWMGEAPQPENLFFGGLGLFTANGIPKASYYVFTLLKRLGSTLLGKGEGWFITREGDSYQIMLYNYRHFSGLYAMGERFDMTFTDRYTSFSPDQLFDVHVNIGDVEGTEYVITETTINRNSGSSFDTWVAMGALELNRQDELDNLSLRSVPAINKYIARAENGTLSLDAMLKLLEVRLIVAEPIK